MTTIKNTLPEENIDIMVTYKKTITYGPYNMKSHKDIVTKRGFYSGLFGKFSIPPEYREFNGYLLPHGFGGDHISPERVIKWEYCN